VIIQISLLLRFPADALYFFLCFVYEQVEVERIDVGEPHVLGILNTHTCLDSSACLSLISPWIWPQTKNLFAQSSYG